MLGEKSRSVFHVVVQKGGSTSEMSKQLRNPCNSVEVGLRKLKQPITLREVGIEKLHCQWDEVGAISLNLKR